MGRFSDWAKGPWKDTVRVKVAYLVENGDEQDRYEIITVIDRNSLNYHRDAVSRVTQKLSKTVKAPKVFRILSVAVEGEVPFIPLGDSW